MFDTLTKQFIVLSTFSLFSACSPSPRQFDIDELIQKYKVSSIRELYPEAIELAQEWNPTPVLEDVVQDVLRIDDEGEWLTSFTFRTEKDLTKFINIYFDVRGNHTKIELELGELGSARLLDPPVNPFELGLKSQDVLAIAIENGGGVFIQDHRYESLSLLLILQHVRLGGDYRLVWRGSFHDLATLEGIDIKIDPNTGEVLEIRHFPEE